MRIRLALDGDTDALVTMGRRMWAETSYRNHIIDNPEQMAAMVTLLLDSPDGVIFIAELEGKPVGMIGMLAYANHLDGRRVAGEVFWWIEPEARGAGLRLLQVAESWAAEVGAQSVQMVAPDDRLGKLYERLGYSRIETSYGKAVA